MIKFVSDCHGADVKWEADTKNTYTQADSYGKTWICQKCSEPCKPVQEKEKDETRD